MSFDFRDSLKTEQQSKNVLLFYDDLRIASYSNSTEDLFGKIIDLKKEYDFKGYLGLNEDFFHRFQIERPEHHISQMKNVAKAFFKHDNKPYVCLVQYLNPNGLSRGHYHKLEEYIVCLAGKIYATLRPIDNVTNEEVICLEPGNILRIAPNTLHILQTKQEGCLTTPIKQTNPKKKDHLYID